MLVECTCVEESIHSTCIRLCKCDNTLLLHVCDGRICLQVPVCPKTLKKMLKRLTDND